MNIQKDRYSLRIDGKRIFVWGAAIHYYRHPHVDEWPKRLKLIKECGINAVDVYFPWNYHSEIEGEYNFAGNRDVDRFLDDVEKAGLYLIARPGPYVCAEMDAGGLPAWLLAKKGLNLRCRRDGRVVYDDEYMKYVRQWWEQIVPKIAGRKNLVLFQIENEFNLLPHLQGPLKFIVREIRRHDANLLFEFSNTETFNLLNYRWLPKLSSQDSRKTEPNPYMQRLYEWTRELGVEVPIFHNDILSTSERQTDVDIMAIDDYPVTDFFSEWRNKKHLFEQTDIIEAGHENFGREEPIFAAEFQSSWFDSWGGPGYDYIRDLLGTDQLDIATKSVLAQRATLISYFMFTGGTTWGYLPSPDVYTSYDMGAPITESGETSDRYFTVKWLIEQVDSLGEDFLATDPDPSVTCNPPWVFCRARRSADRRYVFIRNMGGPAAKVKLSCCHTRFDIGKAEMKLVVLDKDSRVLHEIGAFDSKSVPRTRKKQIDLPVLDNWTLCWGSPQIAAGFDDSGWEAVSGRPKWDFDSIGNYYGYGWYRGTYSGIMKKIRLDARHCFSVFVNGELVASHDNFRNFSGVGDDVPEVFSIDIPAALQTTGGNVITILVESLGHNKDFENDARNPRGIVRIRTFGANVLWRFRGGLLEGEKGLTPVLTPDRFEAYGPKETVALPHYWGSREEGIGLYETRFRLDAGDDPQPVGIVVPEAFSKANIYVNGYLMGRYWQEKGPQHKFFAPWGVLNPCGENHLAIAVWKRLKSGGLGTVRLEAY
ncbi:MAG TPA: beta-galactosidase [bacterium]|nr:beta-galactosidase [bacterium]